MKRYLFAILIACSFSLLGWMDNSASVGARGKVEASFIEADRAQAERNVLEEYGNDIFRTATDFSPVVHSSRSTSHQSSRRHNIPKEQHHAALKGHQGLVTDIFNYNISTALHSAEYYLLTLCRLRI